MFFCLLPFLLMSYLLCKKVILNPGVRTQNVSQDKCVGGRGGMIIVIRKNMSAFCVF